MAGTTTSRIDEHYENFKYEELSFSDTIIKSSGIILRDLYLKAGENSWPCSIFSLSMNSIKLTLNLKKEEAELIKVGDPILIHFSFMGFKPHFIPLSFYVTYQLLDSGNFLQLNEREWMLLLSCQEKPPDFLIRILGDLLTVHTATTKRAETRISVNRATAGELGLKSINVMISIEGNRQECVLRDLSFSGCQVFLNASTPVAKKNINLEILFQDPDTLCEIPGTIMRYTPMKGARDRGTAGIHFDTEQIPHEYAERIHSLID